MDHGSSVRSPSLVGGSSYIMKFWNKTYDKSAVTFVGFSSGAVEYKSPNKQLKDMTPTDFYKFTGVDGAFRGKMLDNCLVHEVSEVRITFYDVAGAVSAAKTPKTAKKVVPVVAPVIEEVKVVAPVESALERKRRLDAERKRNARAAAKAAKASVVTEQAIAA